MKRSGVRRKVDDLGRVVIPASILKVLGITVGEELEFSIDGDRMVVQRPAERCVFCGADAELPAFMDKLAGVLVLPGRAACHRPRPQPLRRLN